MAPTPTPLPAPLRAQLEAHGQAHLVAHWDRLTTDAERHALLADLEVALRARAEQRNGGGGGRAR